MIANVVLGGAAVVLFGVIVWHVVRPETPEERVRRIIREVNAHDEPRGRSYTYSRKH